MEIEQQFRYKKAKHRAKAIRNFYISLMVYCVVLPSIIFVNYMFSPGFTWWYYSAGGMLIGLIIHGISAFSITPFLGKDWEEKKIRELIEREKRTHNP